jgi:hypothetical protein
LPTLEIRTYHSHVMGQRSLSGFLSFKNNVSMNTAIRSFVKSKTTLIEEPTKKKKKNPIIASTTNQSGRVSIIN